MGPAIRQHQRIVRGTRIVGSATRPGAGGGKSGLKCSRPEVTLEDMGTRDGSYDPDAFWEACGARGPLGVVVERDEANGAPGLSARWALPQPFAVVGASMRAEIGLGEAPGLERRHLLLQVIAGRVFALDLGTASGTHWPDGPQPAGWLDPGVSLRVGPYKVRAEVMSGSTSGRSPEPIATADPTAAGSRRSWDLPELNWTIRGAGAPPPDAEVPPAVATWRQGRVLALGGTHAVCALRLRGASLHPCHFATLLSEGGAWLIDLVGSGIARNGVRVRWARLDDGDVLRLGPLAAEVRYAPGFRPGRIALPAASAADGSLEHLLKEIEGLGPEGMSSSFLEVPFPGSSAGHPGVVTTPSGFFTLNDANAERPGGGPIPIKFRQLMVTALQLVRSQHSALRAELEAIKQRLDAAPASTPVPTPAPMPMPMPMPIAPTAVASRPSLPPLPSVAVPPAPAELPPAPALAPAPLPPLRPLFPDRSSAEVAAAREEDQGEFPLFVPTGEPVPDDEDEKKRPEGATLGMLQRISAAQRERRSPFQRLFGRLGGEE